MILRRRRILAARSCVIDIGAQLSPIVSQVLNKATSSGAAEASLHMQVTRRAFVQTSCSIR